MKVLILRPQPGADESAMRARALGLEPIVAPLFTLRALAWQPPDPARFDAVLLTSANAARLGGDGLTAFLALPCYAVGEHSAEAARAAGFADVRTGPSDGAALVALARSEGAEALLHLGGREHIALDRVSHVTVYAAEASGALPADAGDALVLFHSPRAAAAFAALAGRRRGAIRIAAISAQTAAAAGEGWRSVAIAAAPRDQALLELAAKLCQTERR
jgi:uroporphyrinogen-III synthase